MLYLKENQITAIKWLADMKYLTSSQFVKMGLYKKRGYLTNSLKELLDTKKTLVQKHDFEPMYGKLESFYYLTKYGRNFLINELEYAENQIKAPSGYNSISLKDYFHRKFTIDFHIYLKRWIDDNGGKILFLDYYFDKSGNNRSRDKSKHVTALNRIELDSNNSFIPDINTMLELEDNKHLLLFEQHNGKDSKRLFEQLRVHMMAISKNVVSDKYHFQNNPHRVAVVCEFESVKKSVIKRLQKGKNIEYYNNLFLFKTNAELEEDFYNNWTLISDEQVNFLQKSTNTKLDTSP